MPTGSYFRSGAPARTTVTIDPRIELMSVIQLLAQYPLVTRFASSYKQAAEKHFGLHTSHPAIVLFGELSHEGFDFSNVPEVFLAFTPPPELRQRMSMRDDLIEAAGGAERLTDFMAAVRDFATTSRFSNFFDHHQAFYGALISQLEPVVEAAARGLMDYLGVGLADATVILGPLLHDGGFAVHNDADPGRTEAYALIGPAGSHKGKPHFGDANRLEPLTMHEFAHTVINPLVAHHSAEVGRTSSRLEPLLEAMERQGYDSWSQVVAENIIRAITARLTALGHGSELAASAVAGEIDRGFVFVPELCSALQQYERQRGRYRTIADYFPAILSPFSGRGAEMTGKA